MILFIVGLAALVTALAWYKGVAQSGLTSTLTMTKQIIPVLIPALLLAGMTEAMIGVESLQRWLGDEAGFRGILLATGLGAVTPGGPFVLFPLIGVLMKAGTSAGVVAAFISSWCLLGLNRVFIFEIPLLGVRFTVVRLLVSLVTPIGIGLVMQVAWDRFGGTT